METFRVSGAGGQHRDKTSNGVRFRHPPSGAVGECREERSQAANKKKAFLRMAESPKMQSWLRVEHARRTGAIEAWVSEQMRPENLLIEYGQDATEAA